MILSFGEARYEIADLREEWALDGDGIPVCKTCRQDLRFRFQPPDYCEPVWICCDHFRSPLLPVTPAPSD